MIIATTENIAGHRVVTTLGQVFGVVVRSRGIGGNIMAGLRSIVGGEIHEYTQLLEEARRHAVDRLVTNATAMGATAGTVFERVLYKPLLGKKPGPGWVKTTERFVDPDSGRTVDVFYEPSSGERQYVSQDPETASKSR